MRCLEFAAGNGSVSIGFGALGVALPCVLLYARAARRLRPVHHALLLLAVLAAHTNGRISRDAALELLWPEADADAV